MFPTERRASRRLYWGAGKDQTLSHIIKLVIYGAWVRCTVDDVVHLVDEFVTDVYGIDVRLEESRTDAANHLLERLNVIPLGVMDALPRLVGERHAHESH